MPRTYKNSESSKTSYAVPWIYSRNSPAEC